ncbi:MAG: DUF2332 domain-containing protein [Acidimicrobiia bacterium]
MTPAFLEHWASLADSGPLYQHLCRLIADDAELLELVNRIEHKPEPNILFAAVQYLLMEEPDHPLAAYFPSIAPGPPPGHPVDDLFRDYALTHRDQIESMGRTRYTQTNEVRRCVALLPLAMSSGFGRFHLVDLGTSAGLNLGMDRYRYRWNQLTWGGPSPITLTTESRGVDPVLSDIEILRRIGLDLNPLDPNDPDARRWLDALIWPEQFERRSRLRAALEVIESVDVELVAGDALQTLPSVLAGLPAGEPLVLMNSYALMQLEDEERDRIAEIVSEGRRARPIFRVSIEVAIAEERGINLEVDDGSGLRTVGRTHPHGEWIELFDSYARP